MGWLTFELNEVDGGEPLQAMIKDAEGNFRAFEIPAIPLRGRVKRVARDDCPGLEFLFDQSPAAFVGAFEQDLQTAREFDEALGDDEMMEHVRYVMACYRCQIAKTEITLAK